MRSRPSPHAAFFSTWKFAAITLAARFRVTKVTQAVTESGETEADEIVWASRAIIRSITL